jgi:hypothetical protein
MSVLDLGLLSINLVQVCYGRAQAVLGMKLKTMDVRNEAQLPLLILSPTSHQMMGSVSVLTQNKPFALNRVDFYDTLWIYKRECCETVHSNP